MNEQIPGFSTDELVKDILYMVEGATWKYWPIIAILVDPRKKDENSMIRIQWLKQVDPKLLNGES